MIYNRDLHCGFSLPVWLENEGDIIPCDEINTNFNLINVCKSEREQSIDKNEKKINYSEPVGMSDLGI
jgi:hypothetical protein